MPTIKEQPKIEIDSDEAFFLGTEGIRPNRLFILSEEEGELLLEELEAEDSLPAPALREAFTRRRKNLERQQGNGS